ncbi:MULTISPECIES: phage holin family protein [Mycolicibacterium]|uniref:Transmembrane protein n=2 Tax=Mycolicibacterium gilvum TaxID=1804 RepID=A0A378SQ42_9MYCO|nr:MULTISPECIES: phage holin family protein [Mycolicibacterium]ABP45474.1 hypothetical protein Mflv_2997 [Mycolicibacterium gilvum PYR-GCK]MBV5243306.1 phage holin family protein [Mycolicibacterium sp. PAM1]MCV7055600.1 phage holin family protein [Mycolicibacterium gilvum]STZ44218.1 transmembrane protein [Mycolicibacterium gilvum]
MLIVALVLAVIGLAALVLAVVTSNEMIAWVCIAASLVGVILLIVDAIRDRSNRNAGESDSGTTVSGTTDSGEDSGEDEIDYEDYPDEAPVVEEYDETPGETPGEDTVEVDVATGDDGRTGENPVDGDPPRN